MFLWQSLDFSSTLSSLFAYLHLFWNPYLFTFMEGVRIDSKFHHFKLSQFRWGERVCKPIWTRSDKYCQAKVQVQVKSFIRSKLETSAVVWHSSLSCKNRRDLERVQKSAMKVILKNQYSTYEEALKILNMDTLDKRREILCRKFAKNCLKNEKMKKLFPIEKHQHNMKTRSQSFFKVNRARTSRYQRSAIPYLQKLLNVNRKEREKILS